MAGNMPFQVQQQQVENISCLAKNLLHSIRGVTDSWLRWNRQSSQDTSTTSGHSPLWLTVTVIDTSRVSTTKGRKCTLFCIIFLLFYMFGVTICRCRRPTTTLLLPISRQAISNSGLKAIFGVVGWNWEGLTLSRRGSHTDGRRTPWSIARFSRVVWHYCWALKAKHFRHKWSFNWVGFHGPQRSFIRGSWGVPSQHGMLVLAHLFPSSAMTISCQSERQPNRCQSIGN